MSSHSKYSASFLVALLLFCMSSGREQVGFNDFYAQSSFASSSASMSVGGDQTHYLVSPRPDTQRDPFDSRQQPKPISNVTVYLHPGRLWLSNTSNISALHWVFSPGSTTQDIPLDQLECTYVNSNTFIVYF